MLVLTHQKVLQNWIRGRLNAKKCRIVNYFGCPKESRLVQYLKIYVKRLSEEHTYMDRRFEDDTDKLDRNFA